MKPDFYHKVFNLFQESQYWPAEKMLDFQRGQLEQLLRHAKATVPFYQSRLDCIFDAGNQISWSHWNQIPILKRSDLVNEKNSMLASELPPGHGPTEDVFSSGSSGIPISVRQTHLAIWVSEMANHRSQYWQELDWSKNFLSLQIADSEKTQWPEGWNRGPWGPNWFEHARKGTKFILDRATGEEKVIEFINRHHIKYVSSRPLVLQSLALAVERLNMKIQIDAVVAFGGEVDEKIREDLHRILGVRVFAHYSSEEACKIAETCKFGSHFHINAELNFVEILDDAGNPCAIGEPGRVVLTPLFNTAQPLIRYEQGDIAIRGSACSCGRTLPVLQKISGRINDMFEFPGGRKIAPSIPEKDFTNGFGVRIWQLVQTAPLTVEVRYLSENTNSQPNTRFAEIMIKDKLHNELNVQFVQLATIPLTSSGKFLRYKSELPKIIPANLKR